MANPFLQNVGTGEKFRPDLRVHSIELASTRGFFTLTRSSFA